MMSDATLLRVSPEYRRGYRDGENGRPNVYTGSPNPLERPFGRYDYSEGYRAGANDTHWHEVYAGRACDIATRRCGVST